MVTYFLNCMGPIDRDWIARHGSHWRTGRIDVSDGSRTEYGVGVMLDRDWYELSDWLERRETNEALSYADILEEFEEYADRKITWWECDSSVPYPPESSPLPSSVERARLVLRNDPGACTADIVAELLDEVEALRSDLASLRAALEASVQLQSPPSAAPTSTAGSAAHE